MKNDLLHNYEEARQTFMEWEIMDSLRLSQADKEKLHIFAVGYLRGHGYEHSAADTMARGLNHYLFNPRSKHVGGK